MTRTWRLRRMCVYLYSVRARVYAHMLSQQAPGCRGPAILFPALGVRFVHSASWEALVELRVICSYFFSCMPGAQRHGMKSLFEHRSSRCSPALCFVTFGRCINDIPVTVSLSLLLYSSESYSKGGYGDDTYPHLVTGGAPFLNLKRSAMRMTRA